ncbi:LYR motif-containing protein 4 isoform X1 [Dermochelys coriacea]|uniref:LYR motif-containing protein 4 isoform X1 n=1 Tax=Dermochelys coriacea TaxID=27794 RepID=UPI0018E74570|nr:LYR motif-containing protein 4 isoform X1 [Dermochelys coriacea]
MAASNRTQVLRLYRALLRASQRFTAYGYRTYAIRRIRDAFRENKHLKDSEEIQTLVNKARTNLEIIHRQSYWSISLLIQHCRRCSTEEATNSDRFMNLFAVVVVGNKKSSWFVEP